MASRKRKSSSRSGGAWLGLIAGLVLGVAAAVAVALFVTQVPMPFMDKASRSSPTTLLPDVRNAPDPNIGLYGKDGPAGTRSIEQGGSASPSNSTPEPGNNKNPLADDIGQLIAGLNSPATGSTANPVSRPPAPAAPAQPSAPAAGSTAQASGSGTPPAKPAASPAPGTQTIYYLQTGAFRSRDDAEAMRARVLLLGLPVRIEQTQSNGSTLNRVRVGPFKGIDEMNRARSRLGSEKIESSVVRP